jgi:hypothetical protein
MRDNQDATDQQLQDAIRIRTDHLQLICHSLETNYDVWLQNLNRFREEYSILKLFSNRQIMIMIILLSTENRIKCRFLEKLYLSTDFNNQNTKEHNFTLQLFSHYLRSLKIRDADLSEDSISCLYATYKIEQDANTEICLQQLCHFLQALLTNEKEFSKHNSVTNENQQYLVTLSTLDEISFKHDLDMNTCCILLNLFQNQLPSFHQILWCSTATEDDIHLFFSRVRTFQDSTFVVMGINKMHHRFREILLKEQDLLSRLQEPYGLVFYVARGSIMNRKSLRPFEIDLRHREPHQTYAHLLTLFQQSENSIRPQFEIICGAAGIGE